MDTEKHGMLKVTMNPFCLIKKKKYRTKIYIVAR